MKKIAVLGFGTVGSGVVETLDINAETITQRTGGITVKYIVDVRDFPDSPYASLVTKDFAAVENDPEVSIVVETIGGIGVAYEFTKRSLKAGKSVVTSNKELVATYGHELMALAKENGVSYLFEASVGGGVPLLRPLKTCLNGDVIKEIYGILNGTTNYILTQMFQNGVSFAEALATAQKLGYSEADPTADVEGHDACRKACILTSLVTGSHVSQDKVPAKGISGVALEDVEYAAQLGYTIKLLGRCVFEGGKAYSYVAPHLVNKNELVSGVNGVMNGIVIKGNIVGETMFYGAGAGKMPTASAVVADVTAVAMNVRAGECFEWAAPNDEVSGDPASLKNKWFVRVRGELEAELVGRADGISAYVTAEMSETELKAVLGEAEVVAAYRMIG
ncbi:MAG: homoserine dehydrogenase [Oscillospiraceae bacterium]|nr:homoserine dehydrogenase [Oscillospiraceae bacterium]